MSTALQNRHLAALRQQMVNRLRKRSAYDPNIQSLIGVLHSIPGLTTHGSCGGHKRRQSGCAQKDGHWFVSIRAPRPVLDTLTAFCEQHNVRFERGPANKSPLCGQCDSKNEKTWYGLWGTGDPRRTAGQLQRFLLHEN